MTLCPYLWWGIFTATWKNRENPVSKACLPWHFTYVVFVFGMFFNCLNTFWFIKIVQKINRKLGGTEDWKRKNHVKESWLKYEVFVRFVWPRFGNKIANKISLVIKYRITFSLLIATFSNRNINKRSLKYTSPSSQTDMVSTLSIGRSRCRNAILIESTCYCRCSFVSKLKRQNSILIFLPYGSKTACRWVVKSAWHALEQ